jgi:hypothetical protein
MVSDFTREHEDRSVNYERFRDQSHEMTGWLNGATGSEV